MNGQELILNNIGSLISLTAEEQSYFLSLLKPAEIKRKQILEKAGGICRSSAFVTSGCLRGFTVDRNGVEHVLSLAPVNWWIADLYSLISQKPGVLTIQAIEDSSVLLLSKQDQLNLYEQIPKFERFFRILTENALVAHQQRILDNLSLTAEERFENFGKKYPQLLNSVPLKDLASFIGVTPAFFSRMRSRAVKRKI